MLGRLSPRQPLRLRYAVAVGPRRVSTARRAPQQKQWPKSTQTRSPPPPPSSSPSPSPNPNANTTNPPQSYKPSFGWLVTGIFAAGIGFYITQLVISARRLQIEPGIAKVANQKDVAGRYEATADNFDADVGFSEMLMGINRTRKALARQCVGNVLEVGCGTGRNLGYFDLGRAGKIDSLTLVDLSPAMIEVCRRKWAILQAEREKSTTDGLKPGLVVRFLAGSALDNMPPPPPPAAVAAALQVSSGESTVQNFQPRKYDTIIQTMGLCSTPAPVELLTNLTAHLDKSNPDARILLLEHGRSYTDWLNRILDGAAKRHAELHGCWFNRDIGELVTEAAKGAGLEVVRERRRHLGTTWVFELRPSDALVQRRRSELEGTVECGVSSQVQPSLSWRSWLRWS